ncbi:MAG: cupin domain-containing protein [Xanthobacter sp.]
MSQQKTPQILGVKLENGTRITHGSGGNIKNPLKNAPVTMHELYTGDDEDGNLSFEGQFGYIEFNTDCRLPRHVHMILDEETGKYRILPERILVLNGVGITELGGEYFVVAPGTLVDIPPGLPHTWNACPPGILLPDGTISDGTFTMVYNYSEPTSFFPTKETASIQSGDDYIAHTGDVEEIRFPVMSTSNVVECGKLIWNKNIQNVVSVTT